MAERYTRAEMEAALRADLQLAREGADGQRLGRTGRLMRRRSLKAVMNAVNLEGRAVLSAEADGYWRDQDRRYGFGEPGAREPGLYVLRNRLGRVRERLVYRRDERAGRVVRTVLQTAY